MLSPPPSPQERQKMLDARRTHAQRSILANYKDPTKPIYTQDDLIRGGWTVDRMVEDYRDFKLGKCPGVCRRYAIDIPPREISVDIIDPELPPVWGANTRFLCVTDNGRKWKKTREQEIAEALAAYGVIEPTRPLPYPPDSLFGVWAEEQSLYLTDE